MQARSRMRLVAQLLACGVLAAALAACGSKPAATGALSGCAGAALHGG
jgi:hypothetical protein